MIVPQTTPQLLITTTTFYGMIAIHNVVSLATCLPENCLKLLPPIAVNFFQNSLLILFQIRALSYF